MNEAINLSTPEDAYKALMGCPLSQYNTIRAHRVKRGLRLSSSVQTIPVRAANFKLN